MGTQDLIPWPPFLCHSFAPVAGESPGEALGRFGFESPFATPAVGFVHWPRGVLGESAQCCRGFPGRLPRRNHLPKPLRRLPDTPSRNLRMKPDATGRTERPNRAPRRIS